MSLLQLLAIWSILLHFWHALISGSIHLSKWPLSNSLSINAVSLSSCEANSTIVYFYRWYNVGILGILHVFLPSVPK